MSDNSEPSVDTGRRDFLSSAGTGLAGIALGSSVGTNAAEKIQGRFVNTTVLITGATSGIGEATARAFAAEGAKVFFCGRRKELGRAVEKSIRESGGEATYMHADVREEDQVKALVNACVELYGSVDIAFNNAGILGPIGGMDDFVVDGNGGYSDVLRTNTDGVFFAMRHELPVMRKAGKGVIINTGSTLSHYGSDSMGAYAASKHAVIGLTRSAAAREASNGIRVVSVSPGGTRTNIFKTMTGDPSLMKRGGGSMPMGRLAEPEEIAAVVVSVSAPECVFLNGDDVRADGAASAA